MAIYRVFSVGPAGQFRRIGELDCLGDQEAMARMGEFKYFELVEIWQGARRVARVDPRVFRAPES